ncbi:hypothetical protein ABVK25_006969 [Lepraria finkii]|uniref:CCHC-type domain-containing protein n=1 Tax=Lepraria finkii TaxID=1340010 RepID=A0ABR4B792_9LECA
MRCLDSRLSAIGRMPRPRKALRTIKIDPKLIREARELVGACNEKGSQADALTLLLADATPSKPCNNLNCHGWHLPEDCHLPAICTVCGENNQTACHCRMVCARCGVAGHNRMRCVAEKDTFGAPLSPLVGAHRRLTRQPDGLSVAPPADRQGRVRSDPPARSFHTSRPKKERADAQFRRKSPPRYAVRGRDSEKLSPPNWQTSAAAGHTSFKRKRQDSEIRYRRHSRSPR